MEPLPIKLVMMLKDFYLANWADLHVFFVIDRHFCLRCFYIVVSIFLYGVGLKDCLSQNASILRIIWNKIWEGYN